MCADWTTDSLLPCRLWRAGRGSAEKQGPARHFLSSPLAAARVEAWLEGLLLPLALAGPTADLKNALLRRRLGCNVTTVSDIRRRKKQAWEEVALHPPLSAEPAGLAWLLTRRERHRRSTYSCSGTPLLLNVSRLDDSLSLPPTLPSQAGGLERCREEGHWSGYWNS